MPLKVWENQGGSALWHMLCWLKKWRRKVSVFRVAFSRQEEAGGERLASMHVLMLSERCQCEKGSLVGSGAEGCRYGLRWSLRYQIKHIKCILEVIDRSSPCLSSAY